jgi:hypothetical protein
VKTEVIGHASWRTGTFVGDLIKEAFGDLMAAELPTDDGRRTEVLLTAEGEE